MKQPFNRYSRNETSRHQWLLSLIGLIFWSAVVLVPLRSSRASW